MFSKLMKYDMKAGKRAWWIVSIILASSTVISGFILRFCAEYQERDYYSNGFPIYSSIMFFVGFLYVMVLILSQYGLLIPLFVRFYKHLYTDEGYLTFTLPAKRSQILLSETLSISAFTALYFVVIMLCMAFLALIIPTADHANQFINPIVYMELWEELKEIFSEGYGGWLITFIIEGLMFFAASWFFNIVLVQFCITMGSVIAKKHKFLASVGVYIGTTFILSLVSRFITVCIQIVVIYGGTIEILMKLSETQGLLAASLVGFGIVAAFATISLAIYFTTLNLLERKLNLA